MADYRVKNYPGFVDTANVKDDCGKRKGCRFSLKIPFAGREGRDFLRVIMKNPSTADSSRCDRTVLNVCNNVYNAGFGGVIILNLFPLQATAAKEVYRLYKEDREEYETLKIMNLEMIDDLCDGADVVFAWGSNTIHKNKEFQAEYDTMIADVTNIVIQGCARSALAVVMQGAKYPAHPLYGWSDPDFLKETMEAPGFTEADKKKPLTPEDEAYWRSRYLQRVIDPESEKAHPVLHHNMFGPSAQTIAINNAEDFKIYCRKEHDIVEPQCLGCDMWRGDEMGNGRACLWDDYHDGTERVIPNDKKEKEFARVDSDLYGPDDLFNS